MERIVLGCVADVDIERAVETLMAANGVEVVAVVVDLGDSRELEDRRNSALRAGAVRAHVLDAREALARDAVAPALKAGAFQGALALTRALAASVAAQRLVEAVRIEKAAAVAFPFAGDGVLLRTIVEALAPGLRLVDVGRTSRQSADLATGRVDGAVSSAVPAATLDISFDAGVPTGVNGVVMPLMDVLGSLSMLAGEHGIGSAADAAVAILQPAHDALRRAVASRDLDRLCRSLAARYADTILAGRWFTPTRRALDAFFEVADENVSGTVSVELTIGACRIGRCRPTVAESSHGASLVGTV